MKKNRVKRILALSLSLLLITSINAGAAAKKKIKLNRTSAKLTVGTKIRLKSNKKVVWKSKNNNVATVNAKGVVKAKKAGNTKIVAKAGKMKATCRIIVVKKNGKDVPEPDVTGVTTPTPSPVPSPTHYELTPTP